ncbi:MAG: hypothetical protein LBN23_08500 [Paludibacter sp.]|jgi:hypothetical protein|nr:hypothetical protein [Paludibacter sp.]
MRAKFFIFQIFCLTAFCLFSQNKTNELNIGIGYSQYKHTYAMPSGAGGAHYSLDFRHAHKLKSNSSVLFGYFAETDFSNFDTYKNFDYLFYGNGLNAGAFWLINFLKNEKINFYAGGGLFFDANIYYSYDSNTLSSGQGQWFLSPNIYVAGDYSLKKFLFQFRFSMPLLSAGFQSRTLFYSTFGENLKLVLTPNTFTFFTQRFYPQAAISASYPIFQTRKGECRLQAKYAFNALIQNRYPSEKKVINALHLGVVWMLK